MLRRPAVAGSFYPDRREILQAQLADFLAGGAGDTHAVGIVVPHAGYIFSGAIAAQAYKSIVIPRKVVVLGPNHHGLGEQAALFAGGSWLTPLGEVPIATDLASRLLAGCEMLKDDELAHRFEHSLEVQVPFLQMLREDVQIVPIALGHASLDDWLQLGRQIGAVLSEQDEEVLLVASSDMNHFAAAAYTEKVDRLAIERMEGYDPAGLYRLVREKDISMCGVIPVVVMLEAARVLGADSCHLLRYGHSGLVNGDLDSVVGYAALVAEKSALQT